MIENKTRKAFKTWLQTPIGGNHAASVASCYCTYIANCLNFVANIFTEEGVVFADLETIREELSYARLNPGFLVVKETTKEKDAKSALHAFESFVGWLQEYPLLTTLDSILKFLEDKHGKTKGEIEAGNKKDGENKAVAIECDSYRLMFEYFADKQFSPIEFYRFGILNSRYADRISHQAVEDQFELLINLLESGEFGNVASHGRTTRKLSIRKYSGSKAKSGLFLRTYKLVFPNVEIKIDGNASPKENFRRITKCQIYTRSEHASILGDTQEVLKNFQYSHVFDDKTKNPLLFEACWNGVLTPKVTDPLTGHETLGEWPARFQPTFRNEIRRRFVNSILRFNEVADKYRDAIAQAAQQVVATTHNISNADGHAFIGSIMRQWEPISTDMELQFFNTNE